MKKLLILTLINSICLTSLHSTESSSTKQHIEALQRHIKVANGWRMLGAASIGAGIYLTRFHQTPGLTSENNASYRTICDITGVTAIAVGWYITSRTSEKYGEFREKIKTLEVELDHINWQKFNGTFSNPADDIEKAGRAQALT